MNHTTALRLLVISLRLTLLLVLLATFVTSLLTAFAAPVREEGKHSPHQAGMFIHMATPARPATVFVGCSNTGCNNQSAYATNCAGQSWDSWWVVSSTSMVRSGRDVAWLQLWWSATCETNWARLIPQVPYSNDQLTIVLQDCLPINSCACFAVRENCHDTEMTTLLGETIITMQLYAPVANVCVQGSLRDGSTLYGPIITGQFHATNAANRCFNDWNPTA